MLYIKWTLIYINGKRYVKVIVRVILKRFYDHLELRFNNLYVHLSYFESTKLDDLILLSHELT